MTGFILRTCCLLLFSGTFLFANAQWYDPDKVNKKAAAINEKAYEAAMEGRFDVSLKLLDDAIRAEPRFVDAWLSRAGINANMKNYTVSVADYEKAFQLDAVYSATYKLGYSISLAALGRFEDALAAINQFLAIPNLNAQSTKAGEYRKSTYEFAVEQAKKTGSGYVFQPINLGDSINSEHMEYFPSFTIDGQKMIFTRRVNNDEDFYESDLVNGMWSNAKMLAGKVNTNLNEGAQTISQDGEWLIFTGCNYPEGEGSCDLYIAFRKKNGEWSEPENLPINTEFWESSPSLSPDKRELYFSSNAPGGYGGKDIWVSRRNDAGRWERPQNLGPEINTSGDEGCPFIHADNTTLYFNSTGWPGYGQADLFLSRRTTDGWSQAENLGYPINTIDEEGSLVVDASGTKGYFASDRADTRGGLDLYRFELPPHSRALKTLWVKGKVFDKNTQQGLPSSVILTELGTRKLLSQIQTDEEGGFLVTLPEGKDYLFNVNRKGYLFFSGHYNLSEPAKDTFFLVDIPLQPLSAGASVVLKNIFFDVGSAVLRPESEAELNLVVLLLEDNPNLRIRIVGHTDNTGTPADNLALSRERANAVTKFIASKGIAASRLVAEGKGETQPVASNATEEGKSQNRRTELTVISP